MQKLGEELAELRSAIDDKDQNAMEEELGDLLFSCANVSRHIKVDSETALRSANSKFNNRFRFIEQALIKENKTVFEASLEEVDTLWEQAKQQGL